MEVQWFVQLDFKVKLHLTYFIISKRFMKMKVKTSQVQMSVSILEIETEVFSIIYWIPSILSLVAQIVKNLPGIRETWVHSWVGNFPWRMEWQPTPVSLPGEVHGQRSLTGYSPWYLKESETTEQLTLSLSGAGKELAGTLIWPTEIPDCNTPIPTNLKSNGETEG